MKRIAFFMILVSAWWGTMTASPVFPVESQPAYDISVVGTDDAPSINLTINESDGSSVKAGVLQLSVPKDCQEAMLQLFDSNGKLLVIQKIEKEITEIPIPEAETDIYYLSVVSGRRALKTFKIAKLD